MSVINTNVKALYTQAALKATGRASATAMQQLSTGKRINSAKDDAAGLAIATRMTQQIRSLNQAMRNAGDAVSLIQTAEGATSEITNMLQRMRELSIQAINDTNADEQRGYLDLEFQQLKQEIVRIADTTEWNGFPILNGTSGERVGERPVYKATSAGTFNAGLTYTAGTLALTTHAGDVTTGGSGTLSKAGSVNIKLTSATEATATLTLSDGSISTITGGVADATDKTITFTDTALTEGTGSFVLTSTAAFASGDEVDFTVARSFNAVPAMAANDIQINGVTIGVSSAINDTKSLPDSAESSAISRAFAINAKTAETGVAAVVNTNVMTGSAMATGLTSASGTVTINGFTSAPIETVLNNTRESRALVVKAINAISFQTGVVAINGDNDTQGIRLEATDGRNIQVAFNTVSSSSDFAERTGLREGLQVGSFALETSVEGKLNVTSSATGDWTRVGLKPADYTNNQAVINSGVRLVASSAADIRTLGTGDLKINGVAIRAATSSDDTFSSTKSVSSSRSASAIAIAAAINASSADTGVTAKANSVATSGTTTSVASGVTGLQSVYINGVNVQVDFLDTDTEAERRTKVIDAVNGSFGQHGVLASQSGTGGVTLTAVDGRNLSVWYDTDVTDLTASGFGLGVSTGDAAGVKGDSGADASYTGAPTLYASVSLIADRAPKQPPAGAAPSNGAPPPYVSKTFTVEAGVNGFGSEGDFTDLGFTAGTFGGDVNEATSKMTPPRTGRLSFHVGASANQTITIDLSDFGRDGPITGEITGDSGKNPPDVHIATGEAAKSVLAKLDKAMDKVNATRATMGAVMNRLEHVIDNLTNVALNSEASRSQIEDADYARASTELSRTQIMSQAATAVLAQANTDQQTVLKLLQ